jgi:hypothetical protein
MNATLPTTIQYRIDAENCLIYVNDQWDRFAAENDGRGLALVDVLGQSLFSYIADPTILQLYMQMVVLARQGRPATFKYRCDSPKFRRRFEMKFHALDAGVVEFSSTLLEIEPRAEVLLLDRRQPRNGKFLRVCSWCQRIRVGDAWLSAEEAVAKLDLMEEATMPALTHGICETCHGEMMATIAQLPAAG